MRHEYSSHPTKSENYNEQAELDRRLQLLTQLTILVTLQRLESLSTFIDEALQSGIQLHQLEETILHLGAYVGLPRSLQTFQELNRLGYSTTRDPHYTDSGSGLNLSVPSFIPLQFNFFQQPDIQDTLFKVHPGFAWLALSTALPLCFRGGLSPLERALITWVSDVCQNVMNGPYQIHVRMVLQCGGTPELFRQTLDYLSTLTGGCEIGPALLQRAKELLPIALETHKAYDGNTIPLG
ncbi:MAG: carboxymuconolactone decarboxylase family protein [Bacteriovorax sp.]